MKRANDEALAARLWVLLGLSVACYYGVFAFHPELFWLVGVNHYGVWFLDSFAILASNDAVSRGFNPYLPNPLDYFHRPHVYSHWWLYARELGLTRAQNLWVGLALVTGFLAAALARLRPREPRQFLFYLLVLCSPCVLLAINRANNDLVVFILLAAVVPWLLSTDRALGYLAIVLIAFAAGLKYYPAAAVVVLLGGDRDHRRGPLLIAVAIGLLLLVGLDVGGDLRHLDGSITRAEGLMSFSASAAFTAMGLSTGWAALLGGVIGIAIFAWAWWRRPFGDWRIGDEGQSDWLHFVLGAVLLSSCFLTSTNFAYRWIFAVWLLPLLWNLPADEGAPVSARLVARIARILLLVVLWMDGWLSTMLLAYLGKTTPAALLHIVGVAVKCEQPVLWALFGCLLAFLAQHVRLGWRDLAARLLSARA